MTALYDDYLDRTPDAGEIAHWSGLLLGGAPVTIVASGFVDSDEYRLIRVDAAYADILNRGADAGGRADWLRWMKQGLLTTDDIETSFYASQEYYLTHGATNTSFMQSIYQTLLHRDGSPSDYAFWADLIRQHGRPWVIAQFWDATETISERVTLMYEQYLLRTPDAPGLAHWVGFALQLGDSGLRAGLTGNPEYFALASSRFPDATTPVPAPPAPAPPAPAPPAPAPPAPTQPPANPGNVVDCSDFATWSDANDWFQRYAMYGDPGRLDGNHDGIPCEALPGAPRPCPTVCTPEVDTPQVQMLWLQSGRAGSHEVWPNPTPKPHASSANVCGRPGSDWG